MARKQNTRGLSSRKGNFSIYILVDGDCEQDYLNSIRTKEPYKSVFFSQRIKIAPDIPKYSSVESQYHTVCEALNNYDRVLWIIDYDKVNENTQKQKHKSITDADKFKKFSKSFLKMTEFKKYSGKEVFVLINNPSLEFWYLLHFENTSKLYVDSKSAEKALVNYFPEYTKDDEKIRKGIFNLLHERLPTAISNAQLLKEDNTEVGARSDIYKIFINNFELLRAKE